MILCSATSQRDSDKIMFNVKHLKHTHARAHTHTHTPKNLNRFR